MFDFEVALVIATVVTGGIWLLDRLFLRAGRSGKEPVLVEYSRSFFPIIVLVLLVRSFLFEPFRIPSSSMMPTLLVGDFIFVNKFVYGLRLPVIRNTIVTVDQPQRGDVVVFRLPSDPKTNYIKRVVGLPGDTVEYRDKQLSINGVPAALQVDGLYKPTNDPTFTWVRSCWVSRRIRSSSLPAASGGRVYSGFPRGITS